MSRTKVQKTDLFPKLRLFSDPPKSNSKEVEASKRPSESQKQPSQPAAKAPVEQPASLSVEEDIDEEIDEFLQSSLSASEDFTKEETIAEDASLKADYVEKLT